MRPDWSDKVGRAVPGGPPGGLGHPHTGFEIVGLLSESCGSTCVRPLPLAPSPSDGEGERGVRVGGAHVLSLCPLSIGWRGGTVVRFSRPRSRRLVYLPFS